MTILDSNSKPLPSRYILENLATKFDPGDAVVIKAGSRMYGDHSVSISRDAVGIVLDKETVEVADKNWRVYRVLVGLEKLLVFEEFMEPAA